jgi:dTDP-4-dehydrorhamnose 3,5-epimerase
MECAPALASAAPVCNLLAPTAGARMIFTKTTLQGAWLVDLDRKGDERGFFARTMCVDEFAAHGLETEFLQQNMSFTRRRGALRGMHFQHMPYAEAKLVRCVRGALFDVIIDLRPDSPSYKRWEGFVLNDDNQRQLYIPKGFAHGFQTLADNVEVTYLMAGKYAPAHEDGLRYDDPAFKIEWPLPIADLSVKDQNWPAFAG